MTEQSKSQLDRMDSYMRMIEKRAGKAVRPYRADGYVNMMNRYGTRKDISEHYKFNAEPIVPDEILSENYEGNGLFAKIIDTPAEEAIKHGFQLKGVTDENVISFYKESLDELDWEETAMTAVKWARLFGGSIAVMLIDDGRGLEQPLDWRNIKSIDDIRVYDRSVITPDFQSMYSYDPNEPFGNRGSRLGMPERYRVDSMYGSFTVHDSRCLVFQNGVLPERCTNQQYQIWGIPEYVRINRAIKDAEIAHGTAPKMLDRSVQAIYKMKDLANLLATEEGEDVVLKRLEVIDMARGLMNSIALDSEGEEYDFRTFSYSGVSEVINTTCNYLSAVTNIPQTILFGRSPEGMNATGHSDFENYYNYVERIQKRMIRKNLRYLLSVIFQAGLRTGEVSNVPKIDIEFSPLWSLSESDQVSLDQQKAQVQLTKAQTAQTYIQLEVLDPTEVRDKLASEDDFTIDTTISAVDIEEDYVKALERLMEKANKAGAPQMGGAPEMPGMPGMMPDMGGGAIPVPGGNNAALHESPVEEGSNAPDAAPTATKLPQDMSPQELQQTLGDEENTDDESDEHGSVGVLVIKDGEVLCGIRQHDTGHGLICGPGGHIEAGETAYEAAVRETKEEFGIDVKELIPIGYGEKEPETGLTPCLYLCTEYEGTPMCDDDEMKAASFHTMEELEQLKPSLFPPFAYSLTALQMCIDNDYFISDNTHLDGKVKWFSLPYALAKKHNLNVKGLKPSEVWELLSNVGVRPEDFFGKNNSEEN